VITRPSDARARGFTLLEIILALTFVVAAGALALPIMRSALGERRFESAAEVALMQLLIARTEAQARAVPIEVVYRAEPPRIEARSFAGGPDAGASADEPALGALLDAGWAFRPLPRNVRIERELPAIGDAADDAAPGAPPDLERVGRLRLAVYLPDGSALVADPAYVVDDDGRTGRLSVDAWTGLPRFARIADPAAESASTEAGDSGTDPSGDETGAAP
jgi:hypothetical protein